jgi:hypothetical protein
MAGLFSAENETMAREQAALIELLLEQDELHWLQHGDRNTAFFH